MITMTPLKETKIYKGIVEKVRLEFGDKEELHKKEMARLRDKEGTHKKEMAQKDQELEQMRLRLREAGLE